MTLSLMKRYLSENVLDAARRRIKETCATHEKLCVAFSGGKDSTVLFNLVADEARSLGRKVDVLFVDWEIQMPSTIQFVEDELDRHSDVIGRTWWVALPMTTTNTANMINPIWVAWEEGVEHVREKPWFSVKPTELPFWYPKMTYEEFMPTFNSWLADGKRLAQFVGIRTDESLNRFRAISTANKRDGLAHQNALAEHVTMAYPIYDWSTHDIWTYLKTESKPYNRLYDLMIQAGVPLANCRICEPFGQEALKGLWLYHAIEPKLWSKITHRIEGASGWRHSMQGKKLSMVLPAGTTWLQQVLRLLESLPPEVKLHYMVKLHTAWEYLGKKGMKIEDELPNDLSSDDNTSWRRVYKMISKGDYWCKMLSFQPTSLASYDQYITSRKSSAEAFFKSLRTSAV